MLAAPAYLAVRVVAGEPSLAASMWIARFFAGIVPMLLFLSLLWGFLERFAPKRLRPWIPSASGLGIAMVIPGSNCLAMFLGAAGAEWLRHRRPALAERTVVPVASGLIAGESLMGILIAVLIVAGVLAK